MHRPEFAKELGISVPTLIRWEGGEESSLGHTVNERRDTAEKLLATFEVPAEIVGVVSLQVDERIADLEQTVEEIARRLLPPKSGASRPHARL